MTYKNAEWECYCGPEPLLTGQRRPAFFFTAGAIAVIAGLLFPLPTRVLDVLLIFSISLTAAVMVITFAARTASDLSGFALLIVLAAILRMALSVASAKLILSQGDAGSVIGFFGGIIVRNNYVFAVLTFSMLALVLFGTICKAAKGIGRSASKFVCDIATIKQISIDVNLNAGVINNSQALELREKIDRQTGFFIAMADAARFILYAAVIELVIIIVNIIGGMAIGVAGRTAAGVPVKTYVTLAVGAGMVTQIPALLAAVASGYLVRKSYADPVLPVANDRLAEQSSMGVVCVSSCEKERNTQHVICNTPFDAESAEPVREQSSAANTNIEADEKVIAEDIEWFDGAGCIEANSEKGDLKLWAEKEIKNNDCYEAIAELIESKTGVSDVRAKTILMAAESVRQFGVTAPVNIAMRLAQRGKKCLLIDLDLERDAVAKVFDIDCERDGDGNKAQAEAVATCISNLLVWPASNFGKEDALNIKEVIGSGESRYDYLVVYAPNISAADGSIGSDEIAGCARAAMLFSSEGEFESSAISDFRRLLSNYGCTILEPAEVLAEVV